MMTFSEFKQTAAYQREVAPPMELSTFQKENIINDMIDVLDHYNYQWKKSALSEIVDKWWDNKKEHIRLFSKHPNWVEDKFMIVFSNENYKREIDIDTVSDLSCQLSTLCSNNKDKLVTPSINLPWTMKELNTMVYNLETIIDYLERSNFNITKVNGYTKADIPDLRKDLNRAYNNISLYQQNNYGYDRKSEALWIFVSSILSLIISDIRAGEFSPTLTKEQSEFWNDKAEKLGVNIRTGEGQRIMKVIRKWLQVGGIEKLDKTFFNSLVAKLGDALNPLDYTRHTILSFNPIDYLRMSMGTSWTSCHTIDKANVDGRNGDNYHGVHASGTMSYMLDESSMVFYTVHKSYDGEDFELQDKVTRQMWHLGTPENPMMIAARLYPQSNDSAESKGLYKQVREVVERVISEAWDVNNFWNTGSAEDLYQTNAGSTHYRDYASFSSVTKGIKLRGHENFAKIRIGAKPICIECGGTHGENGEINCCTPYNGYVCEQCGEVIDEDDAIYINGYYYCRDCCEFCNYHEEYELPGTDMYYVEDYGYVCDYAMESGQFIYCEHCERYYSDRYVEAIYIDGETYCSAECVEDAGYRYVESIGEWEHIEELFMCDECGEWELEGNAHPTENGVYCPACFASLNEEEAA